MVNSQLQLLENASLSDANLAVRIRDRLLTVTLSKARTHLLDVIKLVSTLIMRDMDLEFVSVDAIDSLVATAVKVYPTVPIDVSIDNAQVDILPPVDAGIVPEMK